MNKKHTSNKFHHFNRSNGLSPYGVQVFPCTAAVTTTTTSKRVWSTRNIPKCADIDDQIAKQVSHTIRKCRSLQLETCTLSRYPEMPPPVISPWSTCVVAKQWEIRIYNCLNNKFDLVSSWITFGNLDAYFTNGCNGFVGKTWTSWTQQ